MNQIKQLLTRWASSRWAPWIIFLVCLTTRLVGAWLGGSNSDDGDRTYTRMAEEFLAGRGLSFEVPGFGRLYSWLPPGMGFIFVGLFWMFDHYEPAHRLVFVLMSALANVSLFYVGKRLLKIEFAFLAALIWAIYPPQWFWASRINPQTYATNMLVFCLVLLYRSWEKESGWTSLLTGFLWATLSFCRGEYIFGIFVLAVLTMKAVQPIRKAVQLSFLLILGWSLGIGPWMVRNYSLHHRILLMTTNYGDNFWKAYNPAYNFSGNDIPFPKELAARLNHETNEVNRADILKAEAMNFIRENPRRALRNVIGNALNFWRPWLSPAAATPLQNLVYVTSYLPLFFLFVWGFQAFPWKESRWLAIAGILAYKFLIHVFFYVIVRYREAVIPLLILIAMRPLERLLLKTEKQTYV